MESREELIRKMMRALEDDELDNVTGGVSTADLAQVREWEEACIHYECKLCGMHGACFSDHKDGCVVRNFPYNDGTFMTQLMANLNSCWSCKHIVYGKNYPSDRKDLYCGIRKK